MIDELRAENVALIKDALITPADGLTVISGESGAGKTALLTAFKLLMGERASADMVREGTDAMVVEGRVFLDDGEEDGHIVSRRIDLRGRSRVTIDGSMASVKELASGLGATVELCGQHAHQRLLNPRTHAELLDRWIGEPAETARAAYREAFVAAREAREHYEHVVELGQVAKERVDDARFTMDRITEVNPEPGELEELQEQLPVVEQQEDILRDVESAHHTLMEDDGVTDRLNKALDALEGRAGVDKRLESFCETLRSSLLDIEGVADDLRDYISGTEIDYGRLSAMQEREAQLQGLKRRYGPRMEDVFARLDEAAEIIAAAEDNSEREAEAKAALEEAEARLTEAARAFLNLEREKAPLLSEEITNQMRRLSMGTARLTVTVEELPQEKFTAVTPTTVEFLFTPAEGMTSRPLRRIASGGEISRVMLACQVVLGALDVTDTFIFDEVDAGVGGKTANALADVLADLAKTCQVICVTHLAQVAVKAERHYLITKSGAVDAEGEGTPILATSLREVEGEERVAEIARMLSGDTAESTLAHARTLLEEAGALGGGQLPLGGLV